MFNMITLAHLRRLCALSAIALAFLSCTATQARAQGFFSVLFGYDYSGDSLCETLRGCEEKHLNVGFSFGKLGKAGGFEEEIAWAKNFFGSNEAGADSNVLTVMSNFVIAPKIGPVRLNPIAIVSFTNNTFGWNAGAGMIVMFGSHVGIRGDIRHFNSFQELNLVGLSLGGGTKLSFGRASAALVLQ